MTDQSHINNRANRTVHPELFDKEEEKVNLVPYFVQQYLNDKRVEERMKEIEPEGTE